MILFEHSLYTFEWIENDEILLFTWSEKTRHMEAEDFREALHNYAGFGFEHRAPAMVVDIRNFKFQMSAELAAWRDEAISPRYVKFGLKKLGYLVPKGASAQMKKAMAGIDRPFKEDYFETFDEVKAWLKK